MLNHTRYYKDIHPTLPFLPFNKNNLTKRLSSCAPTLRNAFMEALYTTMHSLSSSMRPYQERQGTRKAASVISAAQFESSASQALSDKILLLEAMILMAIEADIHGPMGMHSQHSPSQAVWLGSAVGLAYT